MRAADSTANVSGAAFDPVTDEPPKEAVAVSCAPTTVPGERPPDGTRVESVSRTVPPAGSAAGSAGVTPFTLNAPADVPRLAASTVAASAVGFTTSKTSARSP